jgi:hypothetical protein
VKVGFACADCCGDRPAELRARVREMMLSNSPNAREGFLAPEVGRA